MSSPLCPAFGTPCIEKECLAYTPLQIEIYERRGLWDKLTKRDWKYKIIDYVIVGRCVFLNLDFIVRAKDDSEFKEKDE